MDKFPPLSPVNFPILKKKIDETKYYEYLPDHMWGQNNIIHMPIKAYTNRG